LFYASNQNGGTTYTIDPTSGQLTPLGASGVGYVSAMDFGADGQLWGIVFGNGAIVTMDLVTGAATRIATTRSNFNDFGFAADGTAYAHNSGTDSLYTVDLATGVDTLIGPSGTDFVKGFDVIEEGIMRAGLGCNDSTGTPLRFVWNGAPAAGTTMQLGVTAGVVLPVVLLFGIDDPRLDLGLVGAPGCSLQVSTEIVTPPLVTGSFLTIPVANQASVVGLVLFSQGIGIDAAANQLGLVTSDHVQIVGTR
jgi:hypothetical protein